MKPVAFDYHAPTSLPDALDLLHAFADADAKVLAGGQSLVPMLNMRLVRPAHVVDINGLAGLSYVRQEDGVVAIGALTRHRTLERSADVAAWLPALGEAAALIGDRQVRLRGTIGGSLVHADPAAELPTFAAGLDAELLLASQRGQRVLKADQFFLGALTTAAEPDELLLEIRFPCLPPEAGLAFLELARQHGAFAIVSALAVLVPDGQSGVIAAARLCLGGVADTPVRARRAEEQLVGREPSEMAFAEAARLAAAATDPGEDVHGSVEYRRTMAEVMARRALALAAQRTHWGARSEANGR